MLTIHSGGAEGADMYFGNIGAELGYEVIHHSFDGHRVNGEGFRHIHNPFQLFLADVHLCKTNESLHRAYPPKSAFVKRLLQRNYYQVKNSEYVIAIGKLEKSMKAVRGGTGWAVQMGIDRKRLVCVFDDGQTDEWHLYDYDKEIFVEMAFIPAIEESFAGVGTRDITAAGIEAIRNVLHANITWKQPLKVWTAQYRYGEADRFDVTVKGKANLAFAPTWDMVNGIKNGTLSEKEYTRQYINMLEESMQKYSSAWSELLSKKEITLVCFCAKETFCHRIILARFLERLGAKYLGEK
jgi:hypothetical protein